MSLLRIGLTLVSLGVAAFVFGALKGVGVDPAPGNENALPF
jgi:hypothetical protein